MIKHLLYLCGVLLFTATIQAAETQFQNALFVGDSHSYGEFGKAVDQYLRTISNKVTSTASCGSSPSTWMRDDGKYKSTNCGYWRKNADGKETRVNQHEISLFPQELEKLNPDITVFALGTNILASPSNISSELKFVEKMLAANNQAKSKCIWVGPPDLRKNPFKTNLASGVKQLRTTVEKYNCLYIDSIQLTKYPASSSDGIHYGPNDSRAWGEKVTAEIANKLDGIKAPQINSNIPSKLQEGSGVR